MSNMSESGSKDTFVGKFDGIPRQRPRKSIGQVAPRFRQPNGKYWDYRNEPQHQRRFRCDRVQIGEWSQRSLLVHFGDNRRTIEKKLSFAIRRDGDQDFGNYDWFGCTATYSELFQIKFDKVYLVAIVQLTDQQRISLASKQEGISSELTVRPEENRLRILFERNADAERNLRRYLNYMGWDRRDPKAFLPVEAFPDDLEFVIEKQRLSDASGGVLLDFMTSQEPDVVLVSSEGREFPVHKILLSAHSTVFQTMFETEMKEKQSSRVEFKENSTGTLEIIIAVLYGRPRINMEKHLAEVIQFMDMYQFRSFEKLFGKPFSFFITEENVEELFASPVVQNQPEKLAAVEEFRRPISVKPKAPPRKRKRK